MFDPVSTYRIQFHKDFTFKHLRGVIPYLHKLGVKTLYASPVFEAVPGSTHGYDVVDPLKINPEIGTLSELRVVSKQLRELGINWMQDIVPNHMAYHPNNKWLMDVLENGKQSKYAAYFDVNWDSCLYNGRLMVPFLGVSFDEAAEQREIQLVKENHKLRFDYFGQRYPVKAESISTFTSAYIEKVNSDPVLLKNISDKQAYQLCHWQETDNQINFRRFFTVNGLICLNIQDEEVFGHYHQLIKQLLDEGIFQALRVDHVDGLHDPQQYLNRLRELAGPQVYISVEKILESGEEFPRNWPVQGNTGYDFLAVVNNAFTLSKSEKLFTQYYRKLTESKLEIEQSIHEKKAFILKRHMGGELENLYLLFKSLNLATPEELTNVNGFLKEAIAQILIYWPVYRHYGNTMPLSAEDSSALNNVIELAVQSHPQLLTALRLLKQVLNVRTEQGDAGYNARALKFYQRCMQFTGPLMAKGVEDTLMYTYNRFVAHNEVGDAPAAFGYGTEEIHRQMNDRQRSWPLSMNGTSTHDTKRGEDVRARLNVLSDLPHEWLALVSQWQLKGNSLKTNNAPDKNDEYFIYQSLIGAHPMPHSGYDDFTTRMQEYLIKALREGKQNSDWAAPNEAYEEATKKFIAALLSDGSGFKEGFDGFLIRVADHGIINSLAQVLLKFICPGVPDIYQGCELWDLSLVDPDNRRTVNYDIRDKYMRESCTYDGDGWKKLWQHRYNGHIKLHLTRRLLDLRSSDSKAFTNGNYIPLTTTGKYKNNLLAFARQFSESWYIIAVPLHLAAIGCDGAEPLLFNWHDTSILIPDASPRNWESVLCDAKGYASEGLPISALFKSLPLALIKLRKEADRDAGILLHVTSLPSAFGTGDIGPEAYNFVDFLYNSRQRYWQMLPVNPVDKGAGYSPYSANSSMAGNTMLISIETLVSEGLLDKKDVEQINMPSTCRADLDSAFRIKEELFEKAYQNFRATDAGKKQAFEQFKAAQAYWLDDFALYQVCKQINKNKCWYEWPVGLKKRAAAAISKLTKQNAEAIDKEKWLQYVFAGQWQQLKDYAEKKGVLLFGDMPFYISYDSVDVWSRPELFKLDKNGTVQGVAGVPPDYFSAEGQLWGMPVYNWDNLKQTGYEWWLNRIRKNLEYFDLIRLDHFRAFAAYWEVPGSEQTAINGKWVAGPGADFFNAVKKCLGFLPFVAEDLGDIDEDVYKLRDEFGLPGMRVLQFAFGDATAFSDHIPHNYDVNSFAYTGTHDNNTMKGWFTNDADKESRGALNLYTGLKVDVGNVCSVAARLCYSSVSKAVILPLQDVLELDASHRMNMPSSTQGNWTWRLTKGQLNAEVAKKLRDLANIYNR